MTAIGIERLRVAAVLDAPGGDDFAQSAAVGNAVERAVWGHDDHGVGPKERLVPGAGDAGS